jgi:drug/metabolite transporter (DMT)-like permease
VSTRAWLSFGAVSILWGIPYLFIKVAVDDGVPPVFVAWARVALAAVVVMALAWRAGVLAPTRARLRWLALYAVVEIVIPFPLIAVGEQWVASSLAAIVIAAVPLFVALLALRFDPSERVSGGRLLGLLIGLAGVVALVGIDVAGRPYELLGTAAILVAAVGYAAGPMVIKRELAVLDARATMGVTLTVAAVLLTPGALLDPPSAMPSAEALLALAVLGLLCTAMAFVVFAGLLAEVGAGRATVITYVAPVVAVALGIGVLGERPGPGAVAGLLLILAGSWLSTDGRLPPGAAAALARIRGRRSNTEPVARARVDSSIA